ncbi:hypothetical protein NCAS_0G03850 [Naumovozyma castellii]|uniref:Protein-lysine N-methyltransferase EFM6 n=1 Tax=Naumovozyma castellii TaxID=27288 RepID=G0VHG6_NAUCA|nr:hypothetical protein NCAS_0G03770 [Naumovozyma castellii CBS 4309]XP_003677624.1 hypothetical protein NCAS_0G03850 [Naumovozyma castellii CBS 4309]CCC71264.1 hypothetical protein NCAS_0G03770 [Naumovozyma castellii CBS 4309]CCC71272.1 hypothetical protein NCAS_0G03850 [Naumovozyma castellii CBS 4309]
MDGIFGDFEGLVVPRPVEHLGNSDLSFGGKLRSPLKIHEDGGESGCGGKVWIAGELLCDFILEKSGTEDLLNKWPHDGERRFRNVLELGSGTGLVGLCVGLLEKNRFHKNIGVHITDIDQLVPLMQRNIELNGVSKEVVAEGLWWGEPLLESFAPSTVDNLPKTNVVDLILAADCVYLEDAFPLLERTLLDLTESETPPVILMSYRKRRKADKHFFNKIKKNFDVIEVKDFTKYEMYLKMRTHLFQLARRF